MNRLLLAMLALLTGLVTQVTPAYARMSPSGETEIGAPESIGVAKSAAGTIVAADIPAARQERRDRDAQRPRPITRPRVFIPSVLFGPDRAFE